MIWKKIYNALYGSYFKLNWSVKIINNFLKKKLQQKLWNQIFKNKNYAMEFWKNELLVAFRIFFNFFLPILNDNQSLKKIIRKFS